MTRARAVGLAVALVAVVAALAVPAATLTPKSGPAGPQRLADAWPEALVTTVPGLLSDGSSYQPLAFADIGTSVGRATLPRADGLVVRLVVTTSEQAWILREFSVDYPASIAGVVIDGGRVYWLESLWQPDSAGRTTLWYADLPDGEATQLVADSGDAVFMNSPLDLTYEAGRLYWIAATDDNSHSELRSVAVTGGPVSVTPLPSNYLITTWPWLTTTGRGLRGPAGLLETTTSRRVEVPATEDQILACAPPWCRVTTLTPDWQVLERGVMRVDGTGYQVVNQFDTRYSVNEIPMLLGRFEVLGEIGSGVRAPDQLWLYDVPASRSVLLTNLYSRSFGSSPDGLIWWSSGDNEALRWHVVDLRTLS